MIDQRATCESCSFAPGNLRGLVGTVGALFLSVHCGGRDTLALALPCVPLCVCVREKATERECVCVGERVKERVCVTERDCRFRGTRPAVSWCTHRDICIYMYVYIYTYLCIYASMYLCIYPSIYIYIKREKARERER